MEAFFKVSPKVPYIRCSEIASEAILEQKQSVVAKHMACGALHPIFGCQCMHLLSQLTLNFNERRYYGW